LTNATEPEVAGPNYRVRALLRGLALLSCFGPTTRELSLSELAERAELDKGTALRLLDGLVHERFLRRDDARGKYCVGSRVLEIAAGYAGPMALLDIADASLRELALASNQTAALAVMEDGELLQIAVQYPNRALRRHTTVGERFPFHCTSMGKAIAALYSPEEVDALVSARGLPQVTEHTILDRDALVADLELTRARGYAFDAQEFALGLCCVGVAVRDHSGTPVASISIAGPAGEFGGEQLDRYVALVRDTGATISDRLRFRPV